MIKEADNYKIIHLNVRRTYCKNVPDAEDALRLECVLSWFATNLQ